MLTGFAFAVSELSLVLFTTLAPSGAVAFALAGLPLLGRRLDAACRERLNQFLFIPLVAAMLGLIAAATHLGTPENALYVLTGFGRSPLSTEVVAAVAFLAFAGVYWLLTFWPRFGAGVQRAWFTVAAVLAVAFTATVGTAYGEPTIVTWDLWQVPVALCLNALAGGPLIALATWTAAGVEVSRRRASACIAIALAAVLAATAVYASQGFALEGLRNFVRTSALSLAPGYGIAVAAYAVLCCAGVAVEAKAFLLGGGCAGAKRTAVVAAGCALCLAGIFVMRFVFYMTHMTVGLSV